MQNKYNKYIVVLLAFSMLILVSFACQIAGPQIQTPPPSITQVIAVTQMVTVAVEQIPNLDTSRNPKIILQRLDVSFLGQDGHRLIGSGCPGNDGKGSIEDYHFKVQGVDIDREVIRVSVAGDNSTLTWEWPCSDNWGLLAQNLGDGVWEIFIAPSAPAQMYTIIFFYDDNSMALGMIDTR